MTAGKRNGEESVIKRYRVRMAIGASALRTLVGEALTFTSSSCRLLIAKKTGKEPSVVDPNGLIYVLHEEEAEIRKNDDLKYPLVVRGNIYDCVDWTLTSEWDDDDYTNFQSSKINTHWHFLQFDNQASDGVITGFSYEQSVRPFTMLERKIRRDCLSR